MPPPSKPFIIPIFLPHAGCPHRCVFCDQRQTTGSDTALPALEAIKVGIDAFVKFRKDPRRWTEISFYGGNFLGLPRAEVQRLLTLAQGYVQRGVVNGIRFSTRPDTIDRERLTTIAPFAVSAIELGVQTMDDAVLHLNGREHTARDTVDAVAMIRHATSCRLGLQLMVGLAGETEASLVHTAAAVVAMAPDFVRIYPVLVLRGSRLAHWHTEGRYQPLTLDEAVGRTKELYRSLAIAGIQVVRMGLQPTLDLSPEAGVLAGPFHPAFGELVLAAMWQDTLRDHLASADDIGRTATLCAHPRAISQVKGQKNANIAVLVSAFSLDAIDVRADDSLPMDVVSVNGRPCYLLGRSIHPQAGNPERMKT